MFARFRDENATMTSGFSVPGMLFAPESDNTDLSAVHQLTLRDGRQLGWSEYGCRHGYPILYMHREGSCRLDAGFFDEFARDAGFRLIAVDRPGMGASDYRVMYSADQVVHDCEQLVHQLGLRRFGVLSLGGGSVFALALASRLRQRCAFVGLLLPVEQPCQLTGNAVFRTVFTLGLRALISLRRSVSRRDPGFYLQRWTDQLSGPERKHSRQQSVRALLKAVSVEALRQGTSGVAQDIWLGSGGCKPVEFELNLPVHVWSSRMAAVLQTGPQSGNHLRWHFVRRQSQLVTSHVASQVFEVLRAEHNKFV